MLSGNHVYYRWKSLLQRVRPILVVMLRDRSTHIIIIIIIIFIIIIEPKALFEKHVVAENMLG